MPCSIYNLGVTLTTKEKVPARVCGVSGSKGYQNVHLPAGRYMPMEIWRDLNYEDDQDYSDGYTYRIYATDRRNPLYGKRLSIWQNDLFEAVEGKEEYNI